ncbi:hypothetical protein [Lentzea sp. NPDC060358]|uniref:hypothetical protein n=1 Tax=Lentzea sp. NPDC060358 TaxID=3347103 RepID=UPI00364A88A9
MEFLDQPIREYLDQLSLGKVSGDQDQRAVTAILHLERVCISTNAAERTPQHVVEAVLHSELVGHGSIRTGELRDVYHNDDSTLCQHWCHEFIPQTTRACSVRRTRLYRLLERPVRTNAVLDATT